jgi:hypothetical protein
MVAVDQVGEAQVEVGPGLGQGAPPQWRLVWGWGGVQVEVGLGVGDHAEGLGLAGAQVVSVSETTQVGGVVADQVVEVGEVQGVAGGLQPAGAGEAAIGAVGEGDVP